jgi:hypothetical protein
MYNNAQLIYDEIASTNKHSVVPAYMLEMDSKVLNYSEGSFNFNDFFSKSKENSPSPSRF